MAFNKEALTSFATSFEDDFVEKCKSCVQLSQEDKYRDDQQKQPSLLQLQEWDPIHDIVADKINQSVDAIAVERELEMEDEDTLIERKKEELKKWFVNNYQHELNQRQNMEMPGAQGEKKGGDLAFMNLVNLTKQLD